MKPRFFTSAAQFHQWLEKNHDATDELKLGFHKKVSGQKGMTYHEAIEEALCFGWIDGKGENIGVTRYAVRFTPRRPKSNWSLINVRRVKRLKKEGRMKPAGLRAFTARDPKQTGAPRDLSATYLKRFRQNKGAWKFFQEQPPSFAKTAANWVMSAKKEETQLRRLEKLIESSENGIRLGVVAGKPNK